MINTTKPSRNIFTFTIVAMHFLVGVSASLSEEHSTFKIGVILPLSGPVAEYGVAAKNGIELAREENADLLKNIQFVFDDSQYDGKKALSSFQNLKLHGVSLMYVWGYGPNQALVPVAETQHFPIVAVSAERSVAANKRYVLRFCYHIEMIADALLEYLRANNLKHLVVIKTELAYFNGLIEAMQKKLKEGEKVEIADTFEGGDADFKTTITKLRSRKFDSLGIFLLSGQISQFYRQSKQLGFKSATFGTDFFDSLKEVEDAKGAMTGAVFAAPFADSRFVARYVKKYGNDLQVAWAANAYEFALLTGKFFGEQQEKPEADQILQMFRDLKQEQGETSKYRYNESSEGSGVDFKVVARLIQKDSIVDIVK